MSRPRPLNGTAAAVLGYLRDGPRSGWDVATGLRSMVGDFWNVTPSQVYRELRSMEDAGLVEAGDAGARDRRPYSITSAGRQALHAWMDGPLERDVVRIPLLLRLFLEYSTTADRSRIARLVAEYRAQHDGQIERYESKLADLERGGLPHSQLVRYGLHHEEAVRQWLDEVDGA